METNPMNGEGNPPVAAKGRLCIGNSINRMEGAKVVYMTLRKWLYQHLLAYKNHFLKFPFLYLKEENRQKYHSNLSR